MKLFRRVCVVCICFAAPVLLAACASLSAPTITPTIQLPNAPTPQPTSAQSNYSTASAQLFDAHIHYSQDAWVGYPVSSIQAILDRAGIARALVSSTPNEGTWQLYQAAPTRIVPELRPYRTRADLTRWFAEAESVALVEQELERGRGVYRGIGEFHLYGDEAKTPIVKRVVDLAVENNLVLHAHSDAAAIENLFAINPRAKILWAHAGMSTPIATVEQLVARYPNLYVELALRYDVASNGKLDPAWRALFARFPDRFLYGTDTWVTSQWDALPTLAANARGWLAELPADIADKIARRNFETLYGIK